ncbi:ClpXP protease specificity-enhancing factor [Rhodoferax sp.]|jgi:stringent starvation protein B|uniref:ClpXP protease specificity-enhancing factor n=1 Tax=Rhodoferax sp. TaxID=50421 RepID=UPI003784B1EB
MDSNALASTRPYLIRALYEWCTDNAFTPFIAVHADESVRVPNEYIKDGEIVLNISFDATSALKLGNDYIEFKGRFGGVARDILIPVNRVLAIYARENGQGMAFPLVQNLDEDAEEPTTSSGGISSTVVADHGDAGPAPRPPPGSRPTLTRVK